MDGDWVELSELWKSKNHIFHSTSFLEFNYIVFHYKRELLKTMKELDHQSQLEIFSLL